MTIPRIHVKEVNIPNIYLPDWMSRQPNVDHLVPPVVLNIGNPVVDIPDYQYSIPQEELNDQH